MNGRRREERKGFEGERGLLGSRRLEESEFGARVVLKEREMWVQSCRDAEPLNTHRALVAEMKGCDALVGILLAMFEGWVVRKF